MNTWFKVFASYNILQYPSDFIHVLIFVTISKCPKSPKLTKIVINLNIDMYHGGVKIDPYMFTLKNHFHNSDNKMAYFMILPYNYEQN